MDPAVSNRSDLPDEVEVLKDLVWAQAQTAARIEEQKQALEAENQAYKAQIDSLQEQLRLLLHKRFGPSSEKLLADQLRLFNEAEVAVDEVPAEAVTDTITVEAHERKKRGRQALPEALPRVRIEHDLDPEDKVCHCGCQLTPIGETVSEQLDIIPAQVRVLQHVRLKYACKACEETVKTAKLPVQPIPKSNASPGLLAHIAVAKYQDALPLYRQEQILARIGVDLPRATLAHWMIRVGTLVQPLINLMQDKLVAYDILGMDETRLQVLKEAGRKPTSTSYLWVQRGGPPDQPVVLFHYHPSRGQAVAKDLLADYCGYLQTDGYEVYEAIAAGRADLTLVGCWAHARRYFNDAVKAQGKKGQTGKAMMGLSYIRKLYGIEKRYQDAKPEERYQARQEQARPILDALRAWLEASLPQVPSTTATGKALNYLHNQWDKLVRYLDDGRLAIDNNATERAIRPFVIGRRNWLFADTPKGARASAHLYSLIESAKANGLEPYHYLRFLFTELPKANTIEQIEALLPFNLPLENLTSAGVLAPVS